MPTVFSGKLDGSEAVWHFHVSLVAYHLRQARAHALEAAKASKGEPQFTESLLAVIFAALCLEAFANETGEDLIAEAEIEDFYRARQKYRKPNLSSVSCKLITVFERNWSLNLLPTELPLKEVEELVMLRNELVHYRIGEAATKAYLPSPQKLSPTNDGGFRIAFDFMQPPTRIEPSLVERVNAHAAAKSHNSALRVLKLWNEKAGEPPEALAKHSELAEA